MSEVPSTSWLALSLLITGFLGSWHCAAMCGPIVCLLTQKKQLVAYHIGRMISYSALGFISGGLGRYFLQHEQPWFRTISLFFLLTITSLLILQMLSELKIFEFKFNLLKFSLLSSIQKKIYSSEKKTGFLLGFFSVLLPCGWLYSFVAGAAATQSAWSGALVMWMFALSAIPALSFFPTFIQSSLKMTQTKQRRISAVVLALSGVYALVSFFWAHHS